MLITMLQGFLELLYHLRKLEFTSKLLPYVLRILKWNHTFVLKNITINMVAMIYVFMGV